MLPVIPIDAQILRTVIQTNVVQLIQYTVLKRAANIVAQQVPVGIEKILANKPIVAVTVVVKCGDKQPVRLDERYSLVRHVEQIQTALALVLFAIEYHRKHRLVRIGIVNIFVYVYSISRVRSAVRRDTMEKTFDFRSVSAIAKRVFVQPQTLRSAKLVGIWNKLLSRRRSIVVTSRKRQNSKYDYEY